MAPDNWHTFGRRLFLSLIGALTIVTTAKSDCDRTFTSRPGSPLNGTFNAPDLVNPAGNSKTCVYIFQAPPKHRVELTFTGFSLRGTPPECVHEYIDVYAELKSADPKLLIDSPFGGRYCGPIPPRRRVSLYTTVAISYFTDRNVTTPALFHGRYFFFNTSIVTGGVLDTKTECSYTIKADDSRNGTLLTPTYPGAYPKGLSCSYLFLGKKDQRVRLEFRDFDLFFGGPHCPFDTVRVYDGPNDTYPVIGTYCGQQRNLVLYSSETSLLVNFTTINRTSTPQNRGFKAIYEFSESFVKLAKAIMCADFISVVDGEHLRGTECDQKILSKKESTGFVYSPNWPFPYMPKVVCRYFIYGMQDSQHLERVRLHFEVFEVPNKKPPETGCSDAYLKIYLKGQEVNDAFDKYDHELCGGEERDKIRVAIYTSGPGVTPAIMTRNVSYGMTVTSEGPRLVMIFSGGEAQGRGFKAKYTFETEYRIPGTPAPDGSCTFTYRSESKKQGDFNSPRYPSNYPARTNCTYLFRATPNEQVTLVFDHFKVRADRANSTSGSYGPEICQEDWLEMYNMYHDGTETLIGRYCSTSAPGPIESNRGAVGLKVFLHSDAENVFSGFKAHYSFEQARSIYGDCGNNISSTSWGVISSPNYPLNYDGPKGSQASKTCNWYITVRPKHRILLNMESFAVEGEPSARGCPAAVVRIWHTIDGPPLELCGEKSPTDKWQYLSEGPSMRISFISADKSVGAAGFRGVWTEVLAGESLSAALTPLVEVPCDQFRCQKNDFCIAEDLRCNSVDNCGFDDRSDEINCIVEGPETNWLVVSACSVGAAVAILVILCYCCHHRKRRRRQRQRQRQLSRLHQGASSSAGLGSCASGLGEAGVGVSAGSGSGGSMRRQHVCDELGQRFASMDSV